MLARYAREFLTEVPSFDLGEKDPEVVHRARVAIRRLRSALRTCERLFVFGWAQERRDRLRRLSDELSAARDSDVVLGRVTALTRRLPPADRLAMQRLLVTLREARDHAYGRLREAWHDLAHAELAKEVATIADQPIIWRSESPASCVAPRLLEKAYKRLRKRVRRCVEENACEEALHAVRIAAKHYRYALEAFAPVSAKRDRRTARCVERLQDILGEEHDAAITERRLRALVSENAEAFAAGEMAQVEREAKSRARSRWRHAWRRVKDR